ncbi:MULTISPECIES: ABC transporter permease subunit [unclassified Acidovorax]|uniref:ABC transporter permease n=1 Tax=unclassified Acidovorax TaxID=2684926 RepID=UPI0023DE250E|nr:MULTISPECIES: ABC transporter permease subunit [unclassified Acidovorax]GKS83354.1 ABC transporter permease subunit [Acidovorax sp. SUPP1855]GKS93273.1 ABC transporter permease subunit [Acidovorax sp. SUPP2825]GKS99388.1 ABC transporter permease subunit [Acidovorax sp. SUPP3434]
MIDKRFFPRQVVQATGNRWDWALLPLVLAVLFALAWGGSQMARPYQVGDVLPLSLDPWMLPYYLLRTTLRMFIALGASLVFACLFAALAAKYRTAERVMVPLLDILQSIPILGFLSITVTGFIALFPGNLFGVECAAIFAIFTSQAWNMAFSLYQSMRTVPAELREAAAVFQLSGWQRFWRLELPFAMPGLLWNMMMSMSGGWFFVVASEAISVSHQDIKLPGVGSYIALAIEARDLGAIGWAIVGMLVGIVLYDQLFFRPLIAWADKFRFEEGGSEAQPTSWLLSWMRRTSQLKRVVALFVVPLEWSLTRLRRRHDGTSIRARPSVPHPALTRAGDALLAAAVMLAVIWLVRFIHSEVGWHEVGHVFVLGTYTLVRVVVLILLAAVVWVPVGVWIGMNPRWAGRLQAVAQFLAAFPANLMFPLAVVLIVRWHLDPNLWLAPLMVLGTQWYLLFNVIAGASSVPSELRYAAQNLGLSGWLRWKRYLLPAVFPSFVTGAITASGGSWNASIVAEYVTWGDTTLQADGLGSYIAHMTAIGDFPRIALGIGVMCVFVMGMNHFVWRRLYAMAENRMHS